MGLDITILIAIGSLFMGFITGLIINVENKDEKYIRGYENGYADGYEDGYEDSINKDNLN